MGVPGPYPIAWGFQKSRERQRVPKVGVRKGSSLARWLSTKAGFSLLFTLILGTQCRALLKIHMSAQLGPHSQGTEAKVKITQQEVKSDNST